MRQQVFEQNMASLNGKRIFPFNMTWEEFHTTEWSTSSKKFDLILSEPPQVPSLSFQRSAAAHRGQVEEIDRKEITKFPLFCKNVLKPGAFVILVIPFYLFGEWYESFYKAGFQVMEYPYVFSKDSSTVPVRRTTKYPQNGNLFAIICTAPGDHPQDFQPCFSGNFSHVNCSNQATLSTMFNVPQPRSRLLKPDSRIPYNCNELSVKMLCECIHIFCPANGTVLDHYAGTMTTAISALGTDRSCTSIERTEDCFLAAVQRLYKLLPKDSASILFDLDSGESENQEQSLTDHDSSNPIVLDGKDGEIPDVSMSTVEEKEEDLHDVTRPVQRCSAGMDIKINGPDSTCNEKQEESQTSTVNTPTTIFTPIPVSTQILASSSERIENKRSTTLVTDGLNPGDDGKQRLNLLADVRKPRTSAPLRKRRSQTLASALRNQLPDRSNSHGRR